MIEQRRLEYVKRFTFEKLNIPEIIAVSARWEDDNVRMKIYISKELSKAQKESVEDAMVKIIAQFSHGVFYDEYIVTSTANLSHTPHLTYRRRASLA